MGISRCTQIAFSEGDKVFTSLLYKFRAGFMQLFLHTSKLMRFEVTKAF
jgi:hypothetical protein